MRSGRLLLYSNFPKPSSTRARAFIGSRAYISSAASAVSYWPVPVSLITAGPSDALCVTVAAPLMAPFALGMKVTSNVQAAPEATVSPQGVAPEGVAAKSPLATRLEMVSVPPELLVSVTVFGALVVPTVCAGNVRLVGDTVTGSAPVPDRPMICGLPAPEVAMATDPFTAPVAEGVKVTESVHLAAFASAPPQGVVPLPLAAKFPLAVMPEIVMVPVLLFVT